MAVITNCKYCGEKISIRKMPAGHSVPFGFDSNDYHKCRRSKKQNQNKEIAIKDKKKNNLKEIKSKKSINEKKSPGTIEEDFDQSEEFETYEETSSEDVFKNDTVESLRKEIDLEITDKKINKPIIYIAIAALVVIVLVFMNG